jgi:hypothetical protein
MGEVKTPPVPATRVDDIDADGLPPGAFAIFEGTKGDGTSVGLVYICPCGCGHTGVLDFRREPEHHPSWIWDGNRDKPTLSPSVHHIGHWHGYLTAGVWVFCCGK